MDMMELMDTYIYIDRYIMDTMDFMDIHGYDMLNLEGPRQNFGGKTAMVTMAKNFSSKRGMQYLEHPPHHHLAP